MEKQAGLGGAQVGALSRVRDRHGIGIGLGQVAQRTHVHQSTASHLVEAFGRTERPGGDGRALQLHILPQGMAVLDRVTEPVEGVLPNALSQLLPGTSHRLGDHLSEPVCPIQAGERAGKKPTAEL